MKKSFYLLMFATLGCIWSCDNKGGQNNISSSEDQAAYILRDTTIYGFCADGSSMNTLQIITDAGDTINVSTTMAQQKDRVLGGYAVGDEMAVIVNRDSTQAICIINKSMLHGDWVMPNPIDGSSEMGMRILRGGVAESIDQSTVVYKSWRIFNGQLQFTVTREDGIDMEEYQIYEILKLTADSLRVKSLDEDGEIYEYGHPRGEEYTEEDLNGVVLDEGLDDEFNM